MEAERKADKEKIESTSTGTALEGGMAEVMESDGSKESTASGTDQGSSDGARALDEASKAQQSDEDAVGPRGEAGKVSQSGCLNEQGSLEYKEKGGMESERKADRENRESTSGGTTLEDGMADVWEDIRSEESRDSSDGEKTLDDASKSQQFDEDAVGPKGEAREVSQSGGLNKQESLEYKEKGGMDSDREADREKKESSGTALEVGMAEVGEGDGSKKSRVSGTDQSLSDGKRALDDASKAQRSEGDAVGPRGEVGEVSHSGGVNEQGSFEYKEKGNMQSERKADREKRESTSSGTALEGGVAEEGKSDGSKKSSISGTDQSLSEGERALDASKAQQSDGGAEGPHGEARQSGGLNEQGSLFKENSSMESERMVNSEKRESISSGTALEGGMAEVRQDNASKKSRDFGTDQGSSDGERPLGDASKAQKSDEDAEVGEGDGSKESRDASNGERPLYDVSKAQQSDEDAVGSKGEAGEVSQSGGLNEQGSLEYKVKGSMELERKAGRKKGDSTSSGTAIEDGMAEVGEGDGSRESRDSFDGERPLGDASKAQPSDEDAVGPRGEAGEVSQSGGLNEQGSLEYKEKDSMESERKADGENAFSGTALEIRMVDVGEGDRTKQSSVAGTAQGLSDGERSLDASEAQQSDEDAVGPRGEAGDVSQSGGLNEQGSLEYKGNGSMKSERKAYSEKIESTSSGAALEGGMAEVRKGDGSNESTASGTDQGSSDGARALDDTSKGQSSVEDAVGARGEVREVSQSGGLNKQESLKNKEKGGMESEREDDREEKESVCSGTALEVGMAEVGEGDGSEKSRVSGTDQSLFDDERAPDDASKVQKSDEDEVCVSVEAEEAGAVSQSGDLNEQGSLEYKDKGSMESKRKDDREKKESTSTGSALEVGMAEVWEGDGSKKSRVSGTDQGSSDGERALDDASKAKQSDEDAVGPRGEAGEVIRSGGLNVQGSLEYKEKDSMDSERKANSEKRESTSNGTALEGGTAEVRKGDASKKSRDSGTDQGSSDGERPLDASKAQKSDEDAEVGEGDRSKESRDSSDGEISLDNASKAQQSDDDAVGLRGEAGEVSQSGGLNVQGSLEYKEKDSMESERKADGENASSGTALEIRMVDVGEGNGSKQSSISGKDQGSSDGERSLDASEAQKSDEDAVGPRGEAGDVSRSGGLNEQGSLEYKENGSMKSERKAYSEKSESTSSGTALEGGMAEVVKGDGSNKSTASGTDQGSSDGARALDDASKGQTSVEDAVGARGEAGEVSQSGGVNKGKGSMESERKADREKKESSGTALEDGMAEVGEGDGSKKSNVLGTDQCLSDGARALHDVSKAQKSDEDAACPGGQAEEVDHGDDIGEGKREISNGSQVSCSAQTKPPSQAVTAPTKFPWPTNATTVNEVVEEVWNKIEDQCQLFTPSHTNLTQTLSGWKVVRLFVSSTFIDFQNERNILVKKVFPELKEWCEKRRLYLIECDLRWGVPKGTPSRITLCTCLEEIDRCHEDTEGEAFFLNMLGERYGWVPSKDDVPDDVARKYDWVGNSSITHMEILHGAYRFCNRNAAFFLREVEGMPTDVRAKFADPTDLGLRQIDRLRTKLAPRFPEQTFSYTCQYDPTDTSSIKLVGLEKFGQDVLEYFKFAIDRKYPNEVAELTPEEQEDDRQALYLAQKGQLIYGREREIKYLMDYVTGTGDYSRKSLAEQWQAKFHPEKCQQVFGNAGDDGDRSETNDEGTERNSHPPIAVVAPSGQGKSSLMAKFIMEAKQAKLNVFFHLIGCSGDSLSLTEMLARLCRYLALSEDERTANLKEMSTEDVIKLSRTLLREYMDEGKQLLIVIDDLTQLQVDDAEWSDWIPEHLEGSVYMVLSLVSEEHEMSDIQAKVPSIQYLELGHLDHRVRVTIVENYFAQYNKKLDGEQLDLLTRSKGAENALWLALACEELRVYGIFEALTALIRDLPDSLEQLVCYILHRLTMEDETGLVKKALCYLECSRKGLTEQELECLLGDKDTKTPVPNLHLAMVRRTLKPFLRKISGMCRVECITFFHHAIGFVVREKWLSDPTELGNCHLHIADYYQHWYEHHDSSAANNIAFHLSKTNDKARFVNFLTKDSRSRFLGPGLKSNYLRTCRCRKVINTKGPFCSQLFICNFCGSQRKAFGNEGFHNMECCVLCGHFVSRMFRKERNQAYRCQQHPQKGFRFPNAKTCMVCSRKIMKGQEKPAYLCQYCRKGGLPICCGLSTNGRDQPNSASTVTWEDSQPAAASTQTGDDDFL